MKEKKIEIAEVKNARFLRVTKTFELLCRDAAGSEFRLRLPFDGLHALLDATEYAEAKGYLSEDDMEREGPVIVPRTLTVAPLERLGVILTFELNSEKKVMFQVPSASSDETIGRAGHLIAQGVGLLSGGHKN